MSNLTFQHFDKICRFCLKSDVLLQPIFPDDIKNEVNEWNGLELVVNVSDLVGSVTKLQVNLNIFFNFFQILSSTYLFILQIKKDDKLPQYMCPICYDIIEGFLKFRTSCILSFNILEKLIPDTEKSEDILKVSRFDRFSYSL